MSFRIFDRNTRQVSLSQEWKEKLRAQLGPNVSFHADKLAQVRELDLSGSDIRDLSPLRYFTNLEWLDISRSNVTDFQPLLELHHLKELHASFCRLPDLRYFAPLRSLRVLDISYPLNEPCGAHALADLTNLEELYCNACNIRTIAHIFTLPHLQTATLLFNPIPEEEMEALSELQPDCKVLF
ncbi:MAG: hypothetical protein EAZ89_15940 [Bacteroidetes bacterium]|nr:MAG: hypothetical protein EAZ89_15940 [Bacteroidota bacterium]